MTNAPYPDVYQIKENHF